MKFPNFIYGSEPFELIFEMPLERVVKLLDEKINESVFSQLTKQRVVGNVDLNGIKARRVQPFFQNSFKPILDASFHEKEGKTFLVGALRLHRFVQIFMTLWFSILFIGFISVVINNVSNLPETLFFLLAVILFGILGFAFVQFGKWLSRRDREWLKMELSKIPNK